MKVVLVMIVAVSGCITGNTTMQPGEEHFNYTLLFCDEDDCTGELKYLTNRYGGKCAMYSIDESLVGKAEVITDKKSKELGRNKGLMHHKFCVFDERIVWTGSFNPSLRTTRDNVLIINSSALAENYLEEWDELKTNETKRTKYTEIYLNTTKIGNYFCPDDDCLGMLVKNIRAANKSVHFAAYSFTHPKIANELIIADGRGVQIKGIIEKGGPYSKYKLLRDNGLEVREDDSGRLLHHKFFVIDGEVLITGSMNPSKNGVSRNDENVVVIHNKDIAGRYVAYLQNLTKV